MVKIASFVVALIQLIICVIVLICPDTTFNVIMSAVNFVLGMVLVYFSRRRVLTFVVVFALLSYILHMGWFIAVNLFGYNSSYLSFSARSVNLSILFCMLCHTALFWGGVSESKRRTRLSIHFNRKINKETIARVGMLCCLIGFYSRINLLIKQLITTQLLGYSGILEEKLGINGILIQFYYVGVLLLILGLKEKRYVARIVFLATMFVEIVSMFTGGRMYAISMIIAVAYVYFTQVERPKRYMILLGIIVTYFLSVIMSTIADVRMQNEIDIGSVLDVAKNSASTSNPILKFFAEMGGTMIDIIYGINDFPSHTPYGFGMSYIDSVFSIIPYYEENIADINNLYFIKGFRTDAYLGGSWLGEVYYNFSWFGCIFCFFIGRLFGKIENILDRCNKSDDYTGALIVLSFLFYFIVYTRDYFYRFSIAIQVCFVVFVIGYVFSMIKRTRKIKIEAW